MSIGKINNVTEIETQIEMVKEFLKESAPYSFYGEVLGSKTKAYNFLNSDFKSLRNLEQCFAAIGLSIKLEINEFND